MLGFGTTVAHRGGVRVPRMLCPVVLASLLAGCAPDTSEDVEASDDALVGGERSTNVESVGYLSLFTPREERLCTGTLIAPDVVLTAAHCFNHWTGRTEDLAFGIGQYGAGRTVPVSRVRVSPLYRTASGAVDHSHDVAYVVLSRRISIVRLAQIRRTGHRESCDYVTTGYGVHVEGHVPGSPIARGDDGERRALSACADQGFYWDNVIQAHSSNGTACNGDSGAPLRVRNTLDIVGVLSYTTGTCVPGQQFYFAPIALNLPFIDDALARR